MMVRDFLSYRQNEIKVVCKFNTLLELFQEQVEAKAKEMEKQHLIEKEFSEISPDKRDANQTDKKLKSVESSPLLQIKSSQLID